MVPSAATTAWHSRSTTASASASVGASTITRTSGSVPLARTQHPARAAELGFDGAHLVPDRGGAVERRRRSATRTLRSTCGSRVIAVPASVASGAPDRRTTSSS